MAAALSQPETRAFTPDATATSTVAPKGAGGRSTKTVSGVKASDRTAPRRPPLANAPHPPAPRRLTRRPRANWNAIAPHAPMEPSGRGNAVRMPAVDRPMEQAVDSAPVGQGIAAAAVVVPAHRDTDLRGAPSTPRHLRGFVTSVDSSPHGNRGRPAPRRDRFTGRFPQRIDESSANGQT